MKSEGEMLGNHRKISNIITKMKVSPNIDQHIGAIILKLIKMCNNHEQSFPGSQIWATVELLLTIGLADLCFSCWFLVLSCCLLVCCSYFVARASKRRAACYGNTAVHA